VAEEILGPLSGDEVGSILERAGDRFSPEDQRLVRDLSGGQPYLVHLAGDALWRAHDDGEIDPAARRAEASSRALREASRVLAEIWRQWSPSQRYVLASVAVGHLEAQTASLLDTPRFPELHALQAQGFLVRDGTLLRVGPGLLGAWCIAELRVKVRSADPWRDWIGHDSQEVELHASEKQAWIDAVRTAVAGVETSNPAWRSGARAPERRCLRVFFSYSHVDDRHRDRLDRHLAALRREGAIETWCDHRIAAGENWKAKIGDALREADVILLLISADFIASDFCVDVEMTHAIERHRHGTAHVIPIAVRAADWGTLPFASLQALPRDRKPVTLWSNQDKAWSDVAEGIRRLLSSTPH
jgi:hypothetical protein